MINTKGPTVASVFKNLSNNTVATFKFKISLEDIIEFCIIGEKPLNLSDGGAVSFCDSRQGCGLLVRVSKEIILLFKEDGNEGSKNEVVSITHYNKELFTKKATVKDLLTIQAHILALTSPELLNETNENVNNYVFTKNSEEKNSFTDKKVWSVFTSEEMNSFMKNGFNNNTASTGITEESTQPQPTVEKVAETIPEPKVAPEEATKKEETKTAEPPKSTPTEIPFYKKKSFWNGVGAGICLSSAVTYAVIKLRT